MTKKPAKKKEWWEEPADVSDVSEIVSLDKRRKKLEEKAAAYKKKADDNKKRIVRGMRQVVKSDVVEHGGWTVRVSQASGVEYDEALLGALTPEQRESVVRKTVDLNALPEDVKAKVLKSIPARLRKEIVTETLDETLLAEQVRKNKISARMVSKYSTIKKNAPYISHSGPK